jgi:hypothetical protein
MNKLVYIYVPNEFVIGYVVLTLLIKRPAVAMVNKTVAPVFVYVTQPCQIRVRLCLSPWIVASYCIALLQVNEALVYC